MSWREGDGVITWMGELYGGGLWLAREGRHGDSSGTGVPALGHRFGDSGKGR